MNSVLSYKKDIAYAVEKLIKKNKKLIRDKEDLMQIGYIECMKLLKSYNPNKKAKITTYLNSYLSKHIEMEFTKNSSLIKLPKHIFNKRAKFFKGNQDCFKSAEFNLLYNYYNNKSIAFFDEQDLANLAVYENNLDNKLDRELLIKQIKRILHTCKNENYIRVMQLRYGGDYTKSLREVGQELNCTDKNVWVLESKAIKFIKGGLNNGLQLW